MTFDQIRDFVCAKVGKIDDYSKAQCASFVQARHRMIYESFNWKAAQNLIQPVLPDEDTVLAVTCPSLSHVISVRVNGELLDPVSTSYVFESAQDDFDTPSTKPKFYDEFYVASDQTPIIKFYPPLDQSDPDVNYTVWVLGKMEMNPNALSVDIPHTENALIAFVLGDMWEYLHQVGKAQAKFQEANALLKEAQESDTPPATRVRMTTPLSATGNTLGEMTDSACNLIGKFDPDTRLSVEERIRRNYQSLVSAALWPELNIMATVNVSANGDVLVPSIIERVIAVRTNVLTTDPDVGNPYELKYQDVPVWFGVRPEVFESTGAPLKFSYKPPVGVSVMPPYAEAIRFVLTRVGTGTRERISVFVKGLKEGNELYESIDIWAAGNVGEFVANDTTTNLYDTPITVSKPITNGVLTVYGASSGTLLLTLNPLERERKHLRLWLLPTPETQPLSADNSNSVFVFGKQKVTNLVDPSDSCQIRNVENVLINASAADMLFQMGQADRAMALKTKADAAAQALIEQETKQGAYEPRILPYVEPMPMDASTFC